jgi:hypothetical protein
MTKEYFSINEENIITIRISYLFLSCILKLDHWPYCKGIKTAFVLWLL